MPICAMRGNVPPMRISGDVALPLLPLLPPVGAVRVIVCGFTVMVVVPLLPVKFPSPL